MQQPYGEIYAVTNRVNGKQYVGQTTVGIEKRWRQHCTDARRDPRYPLHLAIRKYGPENFIIETLDCGPITSQEELSAAEIAVIASFGTTNRALGYNATFGGGGGKPTVETRLRQSAASREALARPAEFTARAVALYAEGKCVSEIAQSFGYPKDHGQNRVAKVLVKAGVYRGTRTAKST